MRTAWKRALLACLVSGAIIPETIVCDVPNIIISPGYGYYDDGGWYYDDGWGWWGDDCCDDDWGFDFDFGWW